MLVNQSANSAVLLENMSDVLSTVVPKLFYFFLSGRSEIIILTDIHILLTVRAATFYGDSFTI